MAPSELPRRPSASTRPFSTPANPTSSRAAARAGFSTSLSSSSFTAFPDAPGVSSSSHNSSLLSISPIVHANHFASSPMSSATPLPPLTQTSYGLNFESDVEATSTPVVHGSGNSSMHEAGDGDVTGMSTSATSLLSEADRLRLWRHDALLQHQYQTAVFVGDIVLSLTDDPNDAFWLAQVHYNTGHYARARQLLMRQDLELNASCRYLAALCLTQLSKWEDALVVVGETNPFRDQPISETTSPDGGIKLEASMCYLRGIIYANQNNFEKAKDCFKEALTVDVKCYEAFNELISNNLLTPHEEFEFINALDFQETKDGELIKLLYTTKLNKYMGTSTFFHAEHELQTRYRLGNNSDLLQGRAELCFVQCKFKQCLEICEQVLKADQYKFSILPLYLACLHEQEAKNKLYRIAHEMTDNHPAEPVTWLAVGVYYMSIQKISDARRYFSKASMMNPHFGPAWIGFAHTFAAEGEHEQAVSAYSTAARLFQGMHLPSMFLGMQHYKLHNYTLASQYLDAAYLVCNTDPLLLNEMGVVLYHRDELPESLRCFDKALKLAEDLDSDTKAIVSIKLNQGHAYRRLNHFQHALKNFEEVLRVWKHDPEIYSALGMVNLQLNRASIAVMNFQEALSLAPNDPIAWELLKRALEMNVNIHPY
ncbi:uncharacterized protein V1518DRAFT_420601 [Limtongia smithiae]|uniref:uncharacterized protein n=1 Tax=Limtongia smithiae TaxID=1125753 RepID=UPI0034CE551B